MARTASIEMELPHIEAVHRVLNRGQLTEGPETALLEEEFATWLGVDRGRVVAVSSGTSALTSLLVANEVGEGDEVIVPAFCFTAAALAVLRAGAIPVFADVDPTWSLSPEAAAAALSEHTKAAIGVDLHGCPADWDSLEEVVPEGLVLIEDACPAYGATYKGRAAGTLGRSGAAFSLNESKQLPGGEGGLVVAPPRIAERVRALRCFGEVEEVASRRRSSLPGDNWKITEMAAAIARASLPNLDERIETGRRVGLAIRRAAAQSMLAVPHPVPIGADPSWYKVRLTAPTVEAAEKIADYLAREGVPVRGSEVAPLPSHPLFSVERRLPAPEEFPGAAKSWCSFCIGSRGKPVFGVRDDEMETWAEVIRSLPTQLVSP